MLPISQLDILDTCPLPYNHTHHGRLGYPRRTVRVPKRSNRLPRNILLFVPQTQSQYVPRRHRNIHTYLHMRLQLHPQVNILANRPSLYSGKATSLEPWFPPHLQRDIYFSLLHLEPSASASKEKEKEKKIPESVLKAALLRRACEDIKRVMALRSQKQALSMLLQRGSVGDDLWQRFLRAEKEMEDEVRDVVNEVRVYHIGQSLDYYFDWV